MPEEIQSLSWAPALADHVVIITGAAAGIGASVARRLAGPGPQLVLVDRDDARAAQVAEEVNARGGSARAEPLDLADQQAVVQFGATLGLPDWPVVVINCASGMSRTRLADLELAEWLSHYEVNVVAAANLAKGLIPHFAQTGGAIVNVSSEAAFRARKGAMAYDCAKAAVTALTRSLAMELQDYHVRVNTVAPGWTITERHVGYGSEAEERRAELMHARAAGVLGRPALPDEIAGAICFLASPDASYINATTLHVDGGLSIH